MSRKVFAQVSVLVLILLAFFVTPLGAQAGGVCGGSYIVEAGETPDTIAAKCGTSAAAIYAANPGIGTLYAGQVLTVPGNNYTTPSTPVPSTPTPSIISAIISDTNTYNTYNYYNYYPAVSTNGNYIVQVGDTFSSIASRYGVRTLRSVDCEPQYCGYQSFICGTTHPRACINRGCDRTHVNIYPKGTFLWHSPIWNADWENLFISQDQSSMFMFPCKGPQGTGSTSSVNTLSTAQ